MRIIYVQLPWCIGGGKLHFRSPPRAHWYTAEKSSGRWAFWVIRSRHQVTIWIQLNGIFLMSSKPLKHQTPAVYWSSLTWPRRSCKLYVICYMKNKLSQKHHLAPLVCWRCLIYLTQPHLYHPVLSPEHNSSGERTGCATENKIILTGFDCLIYC